MKEELFYINIKDRKLFVHCHIPANCNNQTAYLFLNPVFDEKKRVQRFQAETARGLCSKGCLVARFDYFGTGDSYGELYNFSFDTCLTDISSVTEYIQNEYNVKSINVLGIRIGGSLALMKLNKNDLVKNIFLIEPIVDGKRFLIEQRTRRKAFYKLNNIIIDNQFIEVNSKLFEDHQGYLISEDMISFIENININNINLFEKRIFIFKLNTLFSGKTISLLKNKLESNNYIKEYNVDCKDFWASLESIDTSALTNSIVECHNNEITEVNVRF